MGEITKKYILFNLFNGKIIEVNGGMFQQNMLITKGMFFCW